MAAKNRFCESKYIGKNRRSIYAFTKQYILFGGNNHTNNLGMSVPVRYSLRDHDVAWRANFLGVWGKTYLTLFFAILIGIGLFVPYKI